MCGICGFVGLQDRELLLRMMDQLVHRGPDEGGYYLGEDVGLGHRRLSIIDLESGRQPMSNEQETVWVAFNGEIYNFRELRRDLESRGHLFRTASDTEVLVHGYEEYGIDFLQKLNGMWAFALWDADRKCLIVARDRLGIKPLCYYRDGDKLFFASEYKAILQYPKVDREVDGASIAHYAERRYVPHGRTLFKKIHKLPPAHYLRAHNGRLEIHRYWTLDFEQDRGRTDGDFLEEFRATFTDAVRSRLVSDVPLGAYLSGGLDSSSIVGTMAALGQAPIETFAVGFGSEFDELEHARGVAEAFGAGHRDLIVEPEDLDHLSACVWHQEDPVGDAIVVPLYLLSRMARERVKVVLTGEGADELLGGYIHHSAVIRAARFDRLVPRLLRRLLGVAIEAAPVALLDKFFQYPASMGREGRRRLAQFIAAESATARCDLMGALFERWERQRLFAAGADIDLDAGGDVDELAQQGSMPLGNRLIAREFRTWLPDNILFKQDRLSMAHGIEARVPFLDHRLVELAARLPVHLKNDGRTDKVAIRQSLAQVLPARTQSRKKHAFYMPLEGKFKDKFWTLVHTYLSPERIRRRGLFDAQVVQALQERVEASALVRYKQLMALIILEMWFELFVDGKGRAGERAGSGDVADMASAQSQEKIRG